MYKPFATGTSAAAGFFDRHFHGLKAMLILEALFVRRASALLRLSFPGEASPFFIAADVPCWDTVRRSPSDIPW
jgi:hypothetical protein